MWRWILTPAATTCFTMGSHGFVCFILRLTGSLTPVMPEMSGLILSLIDRRGRKQDGYLRLGDIYKLKLSADLVVLSSCDSALGKDLESEGIIGLPRGFLYAGAKSVIASLWKVNDEATARLMSSLYARIHQGESPEFGIAWGPTRNAARSTVVETLLLGGFCLAGGIQVER